MHARFSFRRLEYFVAVAETGSATGASEKLNVSPPSISAAIAQLEEDFGMQLFMRRQARGMLITRGGRRLLQEAKKMLRHADKLQNIAADWSATVSGILHLGCLQTAAPFILPEVRKKFEEKFPEVRVRQSEGHQAELLAGLRAADFDLCLTYDLCLAADVHFEVLAKLPVYVMLAASHALAGRYSITPEEIGREHMIMLDLPLSSRYFLSVLQYSGVKPKIAERSKDIALVRSMVANGFGYSLGNLRPRSELSPDGKPIKYIPLQTKFPPVQLGLASCYDDEPRAAAAFRAHCRSIFNNKKLLMDIAVAQGR